MKKILRSAIPFLTSQELAQARQDCTIALSPGTYIEEFPLITHSLTIEGVGGFAHLKTPHPQPANGRAILYVARNANADLTVLDQLAPIATKRIPDMQESTARRTAVPT